MITTTHTLTYLLALRSLLLIISFRLIVDPSLIYLSPSLSFYIFSVQYLIIYNEIVFTPTPTQPQPPSPPITTHTHVCSMRNAYYFDEQNEQNSNNLPNASDEQLASCQLYITTTSCLDLTTSSSAQNQYLNKYLKLVKTISLYLGNEYKAAAAATSRNDGGGVVIVLLTGAHVALY